MIYAQEKVNLHTHSFYCGHGSGQLSDFADRAEGVFSVLGFSEHCPVPDDGLPSRMPFSQFDNYIHDIDLLKVERKRMVILKGAECDWSHRYASFYKDDVLGEMGFDYILGSVHFVRTQEGFLKYIPSAKSFDLKDLKWYVKEYTDMIRSGLFIVACHPDLFFGGYRRWDEETEAASRDIISCAVEEGIPLEVNDLGLRKRQIETNIGLRRQYTIPEFWIIARDMGAVLCTNTDAHHPSDTTGFKTEGFVNGSFRFASELGLRYVSWDVGDEGIRCVRD